MRQCAIEFIILQVYIFSSFLFIILVLFKGRKGTIIIELQGEMETKMRVSHKCLWNCIELVGNVRDSHKSILMRMSKRKKIVGLSHPFF